MEGKRDMNVYPTESVVQKALYYGEKWGRSLCS